MVEWSYDAADEEATQRLGAALASALRPGDIVTLNGDLGAGKTRLVQSVAAVLGYGEQTVNSPTFVLIHEYDGPVPLYHIDAYRLRDSDEFLEIGGEEVLDGTRACFIEWADRIADVLPRQRLDVTIVATGPTSRRFTLRAEGERSELLLKAVRLHVESLW